MCIKQSWVTWGGGGGRRRRSFLHSSKPVVKIMNKTKNYSAVDGNTEIALALNSRCPFSAPAWKRPFNPNRLIDRRQQLPRALLYCSRNPISSSFFIFTTIYLLPLTFSSETRMRRPFLAFRPCVCVFFKTYILGMKYFIIHCGFGIDVNSRPRAVRTSVGRI